MYLIKDLPGKRKNATEHAALTPNAVDKKPTPKTKTKVFDAYSKKRELGIDPQFL